MSGVDPDDEGQRAVITAVFSAVGLESDWSAMEVEHRILAALRAHLLASHSAGRCVCTPFPYGDGPHAECDVHGLPSAAYQLGYRTALSDLDLERPCGCRGERGPWCDVHGFAEPRPAGGAS